MRCLSCDVVLSDFEATRKYEDTQHYVELCNKCFSTISDEISVTERSDLYKTSSNNVKTDLSNGEDVEPFYTDDFLFTQEE